MSDVLILLRVDAAAVAMAATTGAAVFISAHRAEAEAARAEGLAQLATWSSAVATAAATALLWLLVHVLPGHGQHRAGVSAS